MATVGVADPSLSALVERDVVAGAAKGSGKLASKIAAKLGAGSQKQAEYESAGSSFGRRVATQAMPHLKRVGKDIGKRVLAKAGSYVRKSLLGFKKGGRVYKRMCMGGKCGGVCKRKMKTFKTRSGKVVKFAMGGKVRHM